MLAVQPPRARYLPACAARSLRFSCPHTGLIVFVVLAASTMIRCGDRGCLHLLCVGGETPCIVGGRQTVKAAAAAGGVISCSTVPLTPDRKRLGPRRTETMTTRLLVDSRVRQETKMELSVEFRQLQLKHDHNLEVAHRFTFDAEKEAPLSTLGAMDGVVVITHAFLVAPDGRNLRIQGRYVTVTDFCTDLFCGGGCGVPRVIVVMACGIQPKHLPPLQAFCAKHNDGTTTVVVGVRTNAGAGDVEGLAPKRLMYTVANALGVHFAYTGISVAAALELFSTADSRNHADLHVVTAGGITIVGHGSVSGVSGGSGVDGGGGSGSGSGVRPSLLEETKSKSVPLATRQQDVKVSAPSTPQAAASASAPRVQTAARAVGTEAKKTSSTARAETKHSATPMDTTPLDQLPDAVPPSLSASGVGTAGPAAKAAVRPMTIGGGVPPAVQPFATSTHQAPAIFAGWAPMSLPAPSWALYGYAAAAAGGGAGGAPMFARRRRRQRPSSSSQHSVLLPVLGSNHRNPLMPTMMSGAAPVSSSMSGRMMPAARSKVPLPLCDDCKSTLQYQSKDLEKKLTLFCCRRSRHKCSLVNMPVWVPSA